MYLKEIGINTRNWVDLDQDRDYWGALVNAAWNLRVPYIVLNLCFFHELMHIFFGQFTIIIQDNTDFFAKRAIIREEDHVRLVKCCRYVDTNYTRFV